MAPWEMAPCVTCWQHETLSSDPQHPREKFTVVWRMLDADCGAGDQIQGSHRLGKHSIYTTSQVTNLSANPYP